MSRPPGRIAEYLEVYDLEPEGPLIADGESIRRTVQTLCELAERAAPLAIHGEPGVGMRALSVWAHHASSRRSSPCVVATMGSCAPASLHESILFGTAAEPGALELSRRGGTLVVSDAHGIATPLMRRLCDEAGDCQIVAKWYGDPAASDPEAAALFGHHVEVPALRARGRGDIVQLVELFLRRFSAPGGPPARVSAGTLERLIARSWPGNVRELRNRVEVAVLLRDGEGRSLDNLLSRDT